jgi:5-methylcytosine-specific restriction endonuclease McrA
MEEQALCSDCGLRPIKYPRLGICHSCYTRKRRIENPEEARRYGRQKMAEWRAKNPEAAKEADRRYKEAHRNELRQRQADRRDIDPEKHRAAARAYYADHREECVERNREWAQKNLAKRQAKDRSWRERNPDKVQEMRLRYYQRHREECLARVRAYRKSHQETVYATQAAWREANRANVNAQMNRNWHRMRAKQLGAFVEDVEKADIYARDNGLCGICGQPVAFNDMELDHVVPLSRGGKHEPANVQCAHATCNRRKGAKLP